MVVSNDTEGLTSGCREYHMSEEDCPFQIDIRREELFVAEVLILALYLFRNGVTAAVAKKVRYTEWVTSILGEDKDSKVVKSVLTLNRNAVIWLFKEVQNWQSSENITGIKVSPLPKKEPEISILTFLASFSERGPEGKRRIPPLEGRLERIVTLAYDLPEKLRKETWFPFVISVFSPSSSAYWISNADINPDCPHFLVPRVWNPFGNDPNTAYLNSSESIKKRGKYKKRKPKDEDTSEAPLTAVAIDAPPIQVPETAKVTDQTTEGMRIERILNAIERLGWERSYTPDADTLVDVTLLKIPNWMDVDSHLIRAWIRTEADPNGIIAGLLRGEQTGGSS